MVTTVISLSIGFLALLNPFALFIYLLPVMSALSQKDFAKVFLKASITSFLIYFTFAVSGDFLFEKVLHIDFESFRIFGGLVILSLALLVILTGRYALIHIKEDLDDLANEIALPFMVGAGTISLSIIVGNHLPVIWTFVVLFLIVGVNYLMVMALKYVREKLPHKFKIAFDKLMGISLRLSAFLIGAIGLNMVMTGIQNLFFH